MSLNRGLDTPNYLLSNSKYAAKVFQLVYEGLWTYSPYDWTPQPALAYAWETEPTVASGDIQDGEKYTFYLYENATWHDGTPVTATDVANSVTLAWQDPFDAENYENIYLIRVNNTHTIELFTNSTGYFEWTRTTGFTVFPHHIWGDDTITGGNISTWVPSVSELVGSGPYTFAAHVPGQYVVLERHPDWHFAIPHPPRTPCPTPTIHGPPIPYILVFIIGFEIFILVYLVIRRARRTSSKK
jgi:peptide/nickel transport system substrate-binding protein